MKIILQYKGSPRKRTLHVWKNTKVQHICDLLPHDPNERLFLEYTGQKLKARATLLKDKIRSGTVISVVTKRHNHRRVLSSLIPTSNTPCMITLENKGETALMSCGHAISPEGLWEYLNNELKSGKTEIRCPFTGDGTNSFTPCNKQWDLNELQQKACLTTNENVDIIRKLRANIVNLEKMRNNLNADATRLKLLSKCKRKNLYCCRGMSVSCPSKRACPKCGVIIEHIAGCPRMGCTVMACNFSFCFICLKSSCNNSNCYVAPLQLVHKDEAKCVRVPKAAILKSRIKFGRKH